MTSRRTVPKTYKLYLGGVFARSESGRHEVVLDHSGAELANVPRASRKDVRDAVRAARGAFPAWADRTAYNRGQILYRIAEALESRSAELERAAVIHQGLDEATARDELGTAVDALVHYAGWTDKLGAVLGSLNPVAAPYHSFTTVEPMGVVALLAPDAPDLFGMVREIAAVLAAGNVVVAIASPRWPLRSLDLGEVFAVSDVPPGVINLLSGRRDELINPLCGHRDVNAILDATGEPDLRRTVELCAVDTVTRVLRAPAAGNGAADGSLLRLENLCEYKSAWHPSGV